MSILYVGIDLANNVFAVHGVNEAGAAGLRQPEQPNTEHDSTTNQLPCKT